MKTVEITATDAAQPHSKTVRAEACQWSPSAILADTWPFDLDYIFVALMKLSIVNIQLDGPHAAGLAAFRLETRRAATHTQRESLERDPDDASRRST